jgi:UDP-glucose:(heptosyl)LPS alpha-1,3-glucosyltransferase
MKSADLLIHPAREEAAGNIIIEAIVSGLPSVVTESVGFSSEVLEHQSGEVLKGDFNQDNFNLLVADTLADEKLSVIKESIRNLSDCDYFFSRFKYIADYIENEF